MYFCGKHYTLTDVRLQFNEQSARVCPGAKTSVVDNLGHHKSFRSHHCIQYRDEIRVSFKGTKALNRYPNKLTIMMIEFYRQKILQIVIPNLSPLQSKARFTFVFIRRVLSNLEIPFQALMVNLKYTNKENYG